MWACKHEQSLGQNFIIMGEIKTKLDDINYKLKPGCVMVDIRTDSVLVNDRYYNMNFAGLHLYETRESVLKEFFKYIFGDIDEF